MKKFLAILLSVCFMLSSLLMAVSAHTTTEEGNLVIDMATYKDSGAFIGSKFSTGQYVFDYTIKAQSFSLGAIDISQYNAIAITYGAEQYASFSENDYLALTSGAIQNSDGTAATATVYAKFTLVDPTLNWFQFVGDDDSLLRTVYAYIDASAYTAGADVYLANFLESCGLAVRDIVFYKGEPPCQHEGGTSDCMHKKICTKCNEEYGDFNYGDHIGNILTSLDGTYCDACGQLVNTSNYHHFDAETATLTVAGYGDMIFYDSPSEYPWYAEASLEAKHLVLTADVNSVSQYAFAGYPIEDIEWGGEESQIYYINDYAFMNCSALKSVHIGPNVEKISASAFASCHGLTSMTVSEYNLFFIAEDNIIYNKARPMDNIKEKTTIHFYPASRTETSFTIPSTIKTIPESLFLNCNNLTSMTIPAGIEVIEDNAFDSCQYLTTVTFENGSRLRYIGMNAFFYNIALSDITLPDSLTFIGDGAFAMCEKITSISIPDGIIDVPTGTFSDCTSLSSVTLPDTLLSISNNAFAWCPSLASITVPSSVIIMGDNVFDSATTVNCYAGSYAEEYAIENSLTYNIVGTSYNSNGVCVDLTQSTTIATGATFSATVTHNTAAFEKSSQYTLSFTSSGVAVQPSGVVAIRLPLDTSVNSTSVKVYSVAANGEKTPISAKAGKNYVTFTTTSVGNYCVEYDMTVKGDVDGNGAINSKDIVLIKLHLANGLAVKFPGAMDYNDDGTINAADMDAIAEYILSK